MATAKDFDLEITFHEVETYGEVMRLTENKMVDAGIVNRLYIKPIRIPSIIQETPLVFNPSQVRYGFLDKQIL